MRIKLTAKNRKLSKIPAIKKWLRECEIKIQRLYASFFIARKGII